MERVMEALEDPELRERLGREQTAYDLEQKKYNEAKGGRIHIDDPNIREKVSANLARKGLSQDLLGQIMEQVEAAKARPNKVLEHAIKRAIATPTVKRKRRWV